jgi:hypothetical protein
MSVKNGLAVMMIPAGGWRYEQPLSSGKTQILEENGYDELERLVLEWRLQHLSFIEPASANMEQVRTDIRLHICRVSPQNCLDKSGTAGFEIRQPLGNRSEHVPTIHRLNAWFALTQRANRIEYAPAGIAEARGKTCAECSQNVDWRDKMCAPCNAAISHQSLHLRGSRSLPEVIVHKLGACRLYGHLNEAAVWLEEGPVLDKNSRSNGADGKREEKPSHCWMPQDR